MKKYSKALDEIAPLFLSSLEKPTNSSRLKRLTQRTKELEQELINDCKKGMSYGTNNKTSNR